MQISQPWLKQGHRQDFRKPTHIRKKLQGEKKENLPEKQVLSVLGEKGKDSQQRANMSKTKRTPR